MKIYDAKGQKKKQAIINLNMNKPKKLREVKKNIIIIVQINFLKN